jgi:hypothetical protein
MCTKDFTQKLDRGMDVYVINAIIDTCTLVQSVSVMDHGVLS